MTSYPTMYKTVRVGKQYYRAIGQDAASKDDVRHVLVNHDTLGPAWFAVTICQPVL